MLTFGVRSGIWIIGYCIKNACLLRVGARCVRLECANEADQLCNNDLFELAEQTFAFLLMDDLMKDSSIVDAFVN